jgi:NitT/TauT family transport system permease protein
MLQRRIRLLRKRVRRDYDTIVLAFVGLVAFFLVWHVASVLSNEAALPTPGEVLEVLVHTFEDDWKDRPIWDTNRMQDHIYLSLTKILYGALLAMVLAVPLGLLMGFSRRAEAFFLIPIELIRPIPPIAWLAFAIAIITVTPMDVVFIIFLGIFFPVFINTMDGVKKVDPILVDAAETLGASRLEVFYKVVLPATVPQMMTGVRVGVGVGWMTIVAAEMVSANGGIGWFIWTYGDLGRYREMFAGMLMLGIVSVVIARGLVVLERRLTK